MAEIYRCVFCQGIDGFTCICDRLPVKLKPKKFRSKLPKSKLIIKTYEIKL